MAARTRWLVLALALAIAAPGCAPKIPPEALQLQPEAPALKQAQTRRFDGGNEEDILAASAGVLQDLGFTLEESETKLGVMVAAKDRTAKDAGQVAGAILLALLGIYTPVDDRQKIRVSLVARPAGERLDSHYVRITFQRIVWNTHNQTRFERIEDAEIYQEFFTKLSKAVFLEANNI